MMDQSNVAFLFSCRSYLVVFWFLRGKSKQRCKWLYSLSHNQSWFAASWTSGSRGESKKNPKQAMSSQNTPEECEEATLSNGDQRQMSSQITADSPSPAACCMFSARTWQDQKLSTALAPPEKWSGCTQPKMKQSLSKQLLLSNFYSLSKVGRGPQPLSPLSLLTTHRQIPTAASGSLAFTCSSGYHPSPPKKAESPFCRTCLWALSTSHRNKAAIEEKEAALPSFRQTLHCTKIPFSPQ